MTIALLCGLPALLAAGVFANTLRNGFVYDDTWTMRQVAAVSDAPLRLLLQSGRCLTYAVHMFDRWLWGSWLPGFHLTNVLLHSCASALVAYAVLGLSRSRKIALLSGLLFAVHPVHVEAVAAVSYRKDLLAMIFVLLTLILWLGTSRPVLRYVGALVCLALALLSKEVASVGLIPMLFLADLLCGSRDARGRAKRIRRATLRILPILAFGITATTHFAGNIFGYFSVTAVYDIHHGLRDYGHVLAAVAESTPENARLLWCPLKLCAYYPTQVPSRFDGSQVMLGILLAVGWIIASVLFAWRAPVVTFAMAWTVILYLPCSNIVPLTPYFVAERYLYVPSFGVCVVAALGLHHFLRVTSQHERVFLRWTSAAVIPLVLTILGARSVKRNMDWYDDSTLWSAAVRDGCDSSRARYDLAVALSKRGRTHEAVDAYRGALGLTPDRADAHFGLGRELLGQNKPEQAIEAFRTVLRLNPSYVEAYVQLAAALTKQGQLDDAVQASRDAIRINPGCFEAYVHLAAARAMQGRLDDAAKAARRAIGIDPARVEAHVNLGAVLKAQGNLDEAIRAYREALRCDSTDHLAHMGFASALRAKGRFDEAIEQYNQAINILKRLVELEGRTQLADTLEFTVKDRDALLGANTSGT